METGWTTDGLNFGQIVFESIPEESRATWAGSIAKGVADLPGAPAELRELHSISRAPERFPEARAVFDRLRAITLSFDENTSTLYSVVARLGESLAKVIYNAGQPTAPFDRNAGWSIAPRLRAVAETNDDLHRLDWYLELLRGEPFGQRPINVDWLRFFLQEASAVLKTIDDVAASDPVDEMAIGNLIAEALGHLNCAWNGRHRADLTPEGLGSMSDEEFEALRAMVEGLRPF